MFTREEWTELYDDALGLASKWSAKTSTRVDDGLVAGLTFCRNTPLVFNFILDRLEAAFGQPDGAFSIVQVPEPVVAELRRGGINEERWNKIVEIFLPILIALARKWAGV